MFIGLFLDSVPLIYVPAFVSVSHSFDCHAFLI